MALVGSLSPGVDTSFRNKIINGNFAIWQRSTSASAIDNYASADRWKIARNTFSRQSHTPGTTWTNSQYYANLTWSSQLFVYINQTIEDIVPLSGKTVTLSFWAKASGTMNVMLNTNTNYGTGGSSGVAVTSWSQQGLTTSWTRYTYTMAIPSLSGKTIGPRETTGLEVGLYFAPVAVDQSASGSVDISDIQLEIGSTPTNFEIRPFGLEMMLCQRYFEKQYFKGTAWGNASNTIALAIPMKTSKRIAPTISIGSDPEGWTTNFPTAAGYSYDTEQASIQNATSVPSTGLARFGAIIEIKAEF